MDSPYIGGIILFAGNFAPRGWAFCDGQLMSISSNQALFSILGTTYGGDGRTTFALPDMRGRVAIHPGTGPGLSTRQLGQRSGSETNTLTSLNLPSHTHAVVGGQAPVAGTITAEMKVNNTSFSSSNPDGNYLGMEGGGLGLYESSEDGSTLNQDAISVNANLAVDLSSIQLTLSGANSPVNNMQPWLGLNYIIALVGVYPSRN